MVACQRGSQLDGHSPERVGSQAYSLRQDRGMGVEQTATSSWPYVLCHTCWTATWYALRTATWYALKLLLRDTEKELFGEGVAFLQRHGKHPL